MSRIVVVEDEALVARSIAATLGAGGHAVLACAATGEEAIGAVAAHQPDLVLMDIHLRGQVDGIDAARQIRATSDVPIVFLTAFSDRAHLDRAKLSTPHAYLVKPYSDRELLTTVEFAINRHRSDRSLHERARWLASTLESLGDGVIALDLDHNVAYINTTAESITGWRNDDVRGLGVIDVFPVEIPDSPEGILRNVRRAQDQRVVVVLDRPAYLRTRSGAKVLIDDSVAPIAGPEGAPVGTVIVFRDVSERHLLESRLTAAERMASMVTMTAGMGHELNNPLTANLVNIELALSLLEQQRDPRGEDGSNPESTLVEVQALLRDAYSGAMRMRDIIATLRELGRPDHGETSVLHLAKTVTTAVQLVKTELAGRALVTTDVRANPAVVGHEGRLIQVFINLLVNAAQSFPQQVGLGRVRVVIDETPDSAVVEITDSGVGIPADVIERIFEPFFTTRRVGAGAGLGLSVVHSIVSAHRGEVTVESTPGAGATFRVRLPRAEGAPQRVPRPTPLPDRPRILLVDDDAVVLRALKRLLEPRFDVRIATSGLEAMRILDTTTLDAIVSDLMMPEMSGIELLETVTARFPELASRTLFVTGGAYTATAEAFVAAHRPRVLFKPIRHEDLLAALARILA